MFELADAPPEGRSYVDAGGKRMQPATHLRVRGVVVDGAVTELPVVA